MFFSVAKKWLLWLVIFNVFASCNTKPNADLLLFNGHILSSEFNGFENLGLAIRGDSILDIGPESELRDKYHFVSEKDLKNGFVYPGFIDAHCHFIGYAKSLLHIDLRYCRSPEEILKALKKGANEWTKKGASLKFLEGWGWDQNLWPESKLPNRNWLDSAFTDIPVILRRIDGHAVWLNTAALQTFEIKAEDCPVGGWMPSDDSGLTGVLVDNAMNLIPEMEIDSILLIEALKQAEINCFASGLTALNDAGIDFKEITLLRALYTKQILKIPISAMALSEDETMEWVLKQGPIIDDRFKLDGFKFFADGALGSRGALLFKDYHDFPGHKGLLLRSTAELEKAFLRAYRAGFQVATHAIGDSANHIVLQLYDDILKGKNPLRWRIEHAQVVQRDDLKFFRKNQIIASVQPTHASSDGHWAEERLGTDRLKTAYAYKTLLEFSPILPLGTDFPIEEIYPLATFRTAVFRPLRSDTSKLFMPEEALTGQEALKGLTIWPAYAQFREDDLGSIAIGKKASFTVLNVNLLNSTLREPNVIQVLSTWIFGEAVYLNPQN